MHNTTFAFLSNLRINPSRLGYTEKEQILYYILACLLHHKTRNVWEVQLINHYTHAVKFKKFWETTLYQIQNLIKKKTIKLLDFCLIFLAKHCKTSKCDEHHPDFTKDNTWKSTKREWHPSDNIKRWETGPSSSCQVARQKSTTGSLTHLGGLLPLHFTVRWLNQQLGGLRHSGCGLSATRPVQTFRQRDISGQTPAVPYIQCGVRLGRVTTAHCARACVCARVCQVLTTLFFFLKCRYANTWWSESNQLKTDQNWELISHKKTLLQMREFSIYTMDPWYENN